jgi:hypothetical protein
MARCNAGLDDRCRDANGRIREKRADTRVETLRKEYGDRFAQGFRSDARLGTVRDKKGMSLTELVREIKKV